jgi:glycosyltransferase involved in cell wall biosynthesis
MTLALLAPVPPPAMPAGPHWGSNFVTIAFLRALLRYGPFERYLFFGADMDTAQQNLQALQVSWPGAQKIELHHVWQLPEILSRTPIQALHTTNNFLHRVVHARSLVPGGHFPVTASAFQSTSFHGVLPEYAQDLITGVWPCDRLAVMSDAMAEVLQGTYAHLAESALAAWSGPKTPPQLRTIYPGIDTEQMRPVPDTPWRRKLHVPDNAFIVLWLSRLSPADKADLQPVLRSFRDYLARTDDHERPIHLVIAGSDYANYGTAVVRWVQEYGIGERVRGVGNPREADKAALMSAADCFLSLTDNPQEAFGYAILEAMACGKPVVASDWDGQKETVSDDVGFRVPTIWGPQRRLDAISPLYWLSETAPMQMAAAQSVAIDMPAAWEAVERLRRDPALTRQMGAAARARAVALFSWQAIIAQYVAMWDEAQTAAATCELPAGPTMRYPMAFAKAYQHYPTRWLDGDLRVCQAQGGGEIDLDSPYVTMQHLLQPALLEQVLMLSGSGTSVDELITATAEDTDTVYRHVLWLLKQGYLRAA